MDGSEISINVASIDDKCDHQVVTLVDARDISGNNGIVQLLHSSSSLPLNGKDQMLLKNKTLSPHCLICNAKLCVSGRGAMQLFSKEAKTSARKMDLYCVLGNIINRDLNISNIHSAIICKRCFKTVDDIDCIEGQLQSMRKDLNEKFLQTEATIKNECLGLSKSTTMHQGKSNSNRENDAPFKLYSSKTKNRRVPVTKKAKPRKSLVPPPFVKLEVKEEDSNDFLTCFNLEESSATFEDSITEIVEEDNFTNSEITESIEPILDVDGLDLHNEDTTIQIGSILLPTINSATLASEEGQDSSQVIYRCRLCQHQEQKFSSIETHLLQNHEDRLFECELCKERFNSRLPLVEHLEQHILSGKKPAECHHCSKRFALPRQLKEHIKYHLSKTVSCYKCPKRFRSENALLQHMNTHTGSRPFQCEKCFKSFATKPILKTHMKIHGNRSRPHKCTDCGKMFLTMHHLHDHVQIHQNKKNYICESCGKKFGSQRSLDLHSITHSGVKNFQCKICNKAFARKGEIDDHERTHTGEKPFQCEICGAQFSQRSNLQTHKRSTHYEDKRYECSECNKAFKRRRLLVYHVMSVHTGERPFKCNYCTAAFVYPEHFKKHLRIHTGEKPFKCEICGKAFNSRDNKNAHKFIHSDKKQYECMLCGVGYMRKPQLVSHIQQHGKTENIEDYIKVNPASIVDEEAQCGGLYIDNNQMEQNLQQMVHGNETNQESVQILNRPGSIIVDQGHIPSYILPLRNEDLELTASQINQIAEVAAAQVASTPMETSDGTHPDSGSDYRFIQLHFDDDDKITVSEEPKSKVLSNDGRHIQFIPSSSFKKTNAGQQTSKLRSWNH